MSVDRIKKLIEDTENAELYRLKALDYAYDSLFFRYRDALYENLEFKAKKNGKNIEEMKRYYDRDLMRFLQIMEDITGIHKELPEYQKNMESKEKPLRESSLPFDF